MDAGKGCHVSAAKIRKILCPVGCAVVTTLVALGALALYLLLFEFDPCGNDVISETLSPDRQLKAVIIHRGCGAVVEDSTDVSVLPANSRLPNGRGNTFILRGVGGVKVDWAAPRLLRIRHDPRHYVGDANTTVQVRCGWFRQETVSVRYTAPIRY